MHDSEIRRSLLKNSIRTSEMGKGINIPVREKGQKFEETHRRKTFWLQHDIADRVDEEIREDRGAMTKIINALLREYFEKRKEIE